MAAKEMLREKRITRGIRNNQLVGEDEEFDQEFYGSEFWLEGHGSDEESYDEQQEEEQVDEFDSDFNDTEDDEDEENSDEDEDRRRGRRKDPSNDPKPQNRYKEPKIVETKRKVTFSDDGTIKKRKVATQISAIDTSAPRARRDSTLSKTLDTEISESIRKEAAELRQKQQQRLKQQEKIKHQFEQRELLQEGLATEVTNRKWIENRKALAKEDEANVETAMKQKPQKEACIRHVSKRGQYNVVIFPSTEVMPSILTQSEESYPKEKSQVRLFLVSSGDDPNLIL